MEARACPEPPSVTDLVAAPCGRSHEPRKVVCADTDQGQESHLLPARPQLVCHLEGDDRAVAPAAETVRARGLDPTDFRQIAGCRQLDTVRAGRVQEAPDRLVVTKVASKARESSHLTHEVVKDRKSTRLNSSHIQKSRMPSSA